MSVGMLKFGPELGIIDSSPRNSVAAIPQNTPRWDKLWRIGDERPKLRTEAQISVQWPKVTWNRGRELLVSCYGRLGIALKNLAGQDGQRNCGFWAETANSRLKTLKIAVKFAAPENLQLSPTSQNSSFQIPGRRLSACYPARGTPKI